MIDSDSSLEARIRSLIEAHDQEGAATEAIRTLAPHVLRYLRSILHDEADAGDAFSHFAEHVWTGLTAFRWECSLRSWGFRLAWSAALDVRRGAWRQRGRRLATTEASRLAEDVRTKSFVRVERQREGLKSLVATLPVEDQSLFSLRITEELSWAEIAEVLAAGGAPVDPGTVAKRFSRLKERIQEMAAERGLLDP